MNLKTKLPKPSGSQYSQYETPQVTKRVGHTSPSYHNHRTSFHPPSFPECCKNKECVRCYGGVFQKASPETLASRELFVRPKNLGKDIDTICAICLVSFEKQKFILKLSCNHYFHYKCIEQWSDLEKYTCPLCRKRYEYP